MIPDFVIHKDGKEVARVGCGCLVVLFVILFLTFYGLFNLIGLR